MLRRWGAGTHGVPSSPVRHGSSPQRSKSKPVNTRTSLHRLSPAAEVGADGGPMDLLQLAGLAPSGATATGTHTEPSLAASPPSTARKVRPSMNTWVAVPGSGPAGKPYFFHSLDRSKTSWRRPSNPGIVVVRYDDFDDGK